MIGVLVVVAAAGSLWSLRIVQKLKLEQEPMKSIATTRWMDHLFFHSAEQEDLGCRFQSLELGCLLPPIPFKAIHDSSLCVRFLLYIAYVGQCALD